MVTDPILKTVNIVTFIEWSQPLRRAQHNVCTSQAGLCVCVCVYFSVITCGQSFLSGLLVGLAARFFWEFCNREKDQCVNSPAKSRKKYLKECDFPLFSSFGYSFNARLRYTVPTKQLKDIKLTELTEERRTKSQEKKENDWAGLLMLASVVLPRAKLITHTHTHMLLQAHPQAHTLTHRRCCSASGTAHLDQSVSIATNHFLCYEQQ